MKSPVNWYQGGSISPHQNNLAKKFGTWYPMASVHGGYAQSMQGIETSQCTSLMQPVGRGDNYGNLYVHVSLILHMHCPPQSSDIIIRDF